MEGDFSLLDLVACISHHKVKKGKVNYVRMFKKLDFKLLYIYIFIVL